MALKNLVEELKLVCTYVIAVAESDMPWQLKYELVARDEVVGEIASNVSVGDLYGAEDHDWAGYEEEIKEFAAVCGGLLADLEKVNLEGDWP